MLATLLLVAVLHSVDAQVDRLLLNHGNVNKDTAFCVLNLSAKYFVEKKALSGSIVIVNINSKSSTSQNSLLEIINSASSYSVMVKDSAFKHKNASHFPEKAKNYMMILDSMEELQRNINQLNKLPTWNPHAKAVVYIQMKQDDEEEDLVKQIINKLREYRLLNVIVFINNKEGTELKTYTWKPYSKTNCAGLCDVIHLLDTCQNGEATQIDKLEDILPNDMNGCPLTIYTVQSEPYVMPPIRKVEQTDTNYTDQYEFNSGIEINMMKMVANITNMTLIVRMFEEEEDIGVLNLNGSATGIFLKLRQEDVDLVIGNMEVNKVMRTWFDASGTYMQDDVTWCVPKAGPAPTWANLITIFTWSTWVTTLSAILVVSFMLHGFSLWERRKQSFWPTNSILMTYSMVLGWGALFKPKSVPFRMLIISWLMFGINLNTAYQSFLRSFLIHPRFEKQIKTDEEIVKTGLAVGGRFTLRDHFNNATLTTQYIYANFENCTTLKKCIQRVGDDRDFAAAGSKIMADYLDQNLWKGASKIYCYQEGEIIYKYSVVVLARKWFPMLNRFNGIIHSLTENGLISKWKNELFVTRVSVPEASDLPLTMQHMLGAFLFLLVGNSFCFLVFLLELFNHAILTFVARCRRFKIKRRVKKGLL